MDQDKLRETLQAQIGELIASRAQTGDAAAKAAATKAIALLEQQVDDLDLAAADSLGAQVDALIANLTEVLDAAPLDAASALGRTIDRLRQLTD